MQKEKEYLLRLSARKKSPQLKQKHAFYGIFMRNHNLQQSFEEIYEQYVKAIFRFAYIKVSNYDAAQDITADTFLRFWKIFSSDKPVQNPRALLYFIARGLIVDHFREKNKKPVSIDVIDERLFSTIDNIQEKLEVKEEIISVLKKLNEIKKEYREIIILHYIEEFEISEIAILLNKKENTARVILFRALKSLKEKL